MKEINVTEFEQKCGDGRCPKILISPDGDALIQGLNVQHDIKSHLNVPDNENVVFLPKDVIREFIQNMK